MGPVSGRGPRSREAQKDGSQKAGGKLDATKREEEHRKLQHPIGSGDLVESSREKNQDT